jgi:hypothetical protein
MLDKSGAFTSLFDEQRPTTHWEIAGYAEAFDGCGAQGE